MSMAFNQTSYASSTGILAFPEPYVAVAQKLAQHDATHADVGTREIVKAGTIWPHNDYRAKGIILNDVDVTDGDEMAALLIFGFVKESALPEAPTDDEAAVFDAPTFTSGAFAAGSFTSGAFDGAATPPTHAADTFVAPSHAADTFDAGGYAPAVLGSRSVLKGIFFLPV